MKLMKFETMIGELAEKFAVNNGYTIQYLNPFNDLYGNEWKNEYAKIIVENVYKIITVHDEYIDCRDLTMLMKTRDREDFYVNGADVQFQIVFFGLMILAIDNDSYNEKLSILTDFAYMSGFSEDMMNDWVAAVKAVLSVEKIDINKMKSEQAKDFFSVLEKK